MATNFKYNAFTNLIALKEATKELIYYWRHNLLHQPCLWVDDALAMYDYLCKKTPDKLLSLKYLLMIPTPNIRKLLDFEPTQYTSVEDGITFWMQILAPDLLRTINDVETGQEHLDEGTRKEDKPIRTDISTHFGILCSHRSYVKFFARLFEVVATNDCNQSSKLFANFYEEWERLGGKGKINEHDLCKIDPYEIIGYHGEWGLLKETDETNKLVQVKKKEPEWWKMMYRQSITHHYVSSQHHPENYEGRNMSTIDLCESTFDMLACNLQRSLWAEHEVSAADMILISPGFLERYNKHDRKQVTRLLYLFGKGLDDLLVTVSLFWINEATQTVNEENRKQLWITDILRNTLEIIRDRTFSFATNVQKFAQNESLKLKWETFVNENEKGI